MMSIDNMMLNASIRIINTISSGLFIVDRKPFIDKIIEEVLIKPRSILVIFAPVLRKRMSSIVLKHAIKNIMYGITDTDLPNKLPPLKCSITVVTNTKPSSTIDRESDDINNFFRRRRHKPYSSLYILYNVVGSGIYVL
ncbi:MAG: hypothetical protein QXF17_01035 [Ignisphaera sp.]